ncbi:MAG: hypothetical protein ACK4OO_00685 [bacterium]
MMKILSDHPSYFYSSISQIRHLSVQFLTLVISHSPKCCLRGWVAVVTLFSLISGEFLWSQVSYERKSVSHFNVVWLATPSAREIDKDDVSKLLKEIRQFLAMERFDDNPLPPDLIDQFVQEANKRSNLTLDQIASLMNIYIVPSIQKILEETAPVRARELVPEEQRQGFLATKAKEWGLTIEQLEKVMNSAYLYLPVLTKFSLKKAQQEDRWYVEMEGGVIWFRVVTSSEPPKLVQRAVLTTESMGYGKKGYAVENCAVNFARNLQIATRKLPEFSLIGQVYEVHGDKVAFNLGRKEGLGYDEPVWIGEWEEQSGGKINFKKDGWARITQVADNRQNPTLFSNAQAIKRGSWGVGMMVMECPQLPIDVSLKPMLTSFKQKELRRSWWWEISWNEEDAFIFSFDLDGQYNIAPLFGRQSFLLLGFNLSFPPNDTVGISGEDVTASLWGIHLGYFKRYYFHQLGVNWETKYGWRWYGVSASGEQLLTLTLRGWEGNIGVDWAFSPSFNFGGRLGFRSYPPSRDWRWSNGDIYALGPEVDLSGVQFGVYLHWSPPALPFDPWGLFRGALLGD